MSFFRIYGLKPEFFNGGFNKQLTTERTQQ